MAAARLITFAIKNGISIFFLNIPKQVLYLSRMLNTSAPIRSDS
jgi:hypothetical protein